MQQSSLSPSSRTRPLFLALLFATTSVAPTGAQTLNPLPFILTGTVEPRAFCAGADFTFTLTFNSDPDSLSNDTRFAIAIPAGVTLLAATPSGNSVFNSMSTEWTILAASPGSEPLTAELILHFRADPQPIPELEGYLKLPLFVRTEYAVEPFRFPAYLICDGCLDVELRLLESHRDSDEDCVSNVCGGAVLLHLEVVNHGPVSADPVAIGLRASTSSEAVDRWAFYSDPDTDPVEINPFRDTYVREIPRLEPGEVFDFRWTISFIAPIGDHVKVAWNASVTPTLLQDPIPNNEQAARSSVRTGGGSGGCFLGSLPAGHP